VNLQQNTLSSTREDNTRNLFVESIDGQSVFTTSERMDVAGMQFTLNTGDLSIFRISSDFFDENQIGFFEKSDGVYNISIANSQAVEIDADEILFNVEYDCTDCDFEMINLDQKGMTPEIYIGNTLEVNKLTLENRNTDNLISSFSVQQNNPNPWTSFTQIDVTMADDSDVTINVYDVNSRLVYTSNRYLTKGTSTIELDDNMVKGSGVFYYEISTDSQRAQYKMIKLQ